MSSELSPRLVAIAGPLCDTVVEVEGEEVAIGRGVANRLNIPDPALSRQHCVISRSGDDYLIRDLGSRHGTLVNGAPVTQQALQHGDQITVGGSVFAFLLIDDAVRSRHAQAELEDSEPRGKTTLLTQREVEYLQQEKPVESPEPGSRVARDLNTLLTISKHISKLRESEALAWELLGMIFDVVPADRGAFLAFDGGIEQVNWSVAWDKGRGPGYPVRVSRTVATRVIRGKSGLMINGVADNAELRKSAAFSGVPVQAILCVPVSINQKLGALIYVDTQNPKTQFDLDHLQMLTAIAGLASLALDNIAYFEALKRENQELRKQITVEHNMVGSSPRMREVFEFIRRVAPTDSTVLIQGESGTGKEMVAHAVHTSSQRAHGPFVPINCAAIAENLLESELFGHEKGAFTGAVTQKKGKIEMAAGGTLFLDEIGELALPLQAKLLRVLQEREFERVGGTRPIKVDLRLIAATNQDLEQQIQSGKFRKDLYYRLNVVAITVPPLRERREDIPTLAEHFIAKASRKCNTHVKGLPEETTVCLSQYDWPGNVRELENAMERALVLGSTSSILVEDLPDAVSESGSGTGAPVTKYAGAMKDTKKQLVLQALEEAGGNYIDAAKALGLHPNSLLRLIRRLDLKETVNSQRSGASQ